MKNVIIADDFATQRNLIKMIVNSAGVDCIEAENGKEVIKLLNEHSVDGVITDLEMPEMDGYELTKSIRNNPLTKNLPILMITSVNEFEAKAKQAGVTEFIHKPFDNTDVIAAIERHITNKEGESFNVLLLDDDEMQTSVWEKSLDLPYFNFISTHSAREALHELRRSTVDAIITDYKMPDVDGMMFVRKIKSMDEFKHLPVLMVSEPDFHNEIDTSQGINKVFPKPFNSQNVKNELKKLLNV